MNPEGGEVMRTLSVRTLAMLAGILSAGAGCEATHSPRHVGMQKFDGTRDNIELTKGILPPDFDLSGENQSLFDALTEDVVLKVTVREGANVSGEFHGKQAVMDSFRRLAEVAVFRPENAQQYLGDGNRVVVLGYGTLEMRETGATTQSEYAIVVDYREGFVSSILVIQDFSAIAEDSSPSSGEMARKSGTTSTEEEEIEQKVGP